MPTKKWLRNIFGNTIDSSGEELQAIQVKFHHFLTLLEYNNQTLKLISDMEEKSQGDFLFDITYIKTSLTRLRSCCANLINEMTAIGGKEYEPLRKKYTEIDRNIDLLLPGLRPIEEDDIAIPVSQLDRDRVHSVGSKNAQLGELKKKLGLPVPDGFAISTWAYKRFLDANDLTNRIADKIQSLSLSSPEELNRVSNEISLLVESAPLPRDVEDAITNELDSLTSRSKADRFALRSSAIGEDTMYSFAGQYKTLLNVKTADVLDRYREIIAGKFTPQAIYYCLSHSLAEADLPMSVGCINMIESSASGVIYTRNPVAPDEDMILIHSVYGLGEHLLGGRVTPDSFVIDRSTGDIRDAEIAEKSSMQICDDKGGTVVTEVPQHLRKKASVSKEQLALLRTYALQIEEHYGTPQDIEWTIDSDGKAIVLQTRPLRLVAKQDTGKFDMSSLQLLSCGGQTVCPGAGAGEVFRITSVSDLADVPEGSVLIAPHSYPGLITVMGKIRALVTAVGSVASHMAAIAREYRLPTICGLEDALNLSAGKPVTVDATRCCIYDGNQQHVVDARIPDYELLADTEIMRLLEQILTLVSPLHLINPSDKSFTMENCRTIHDLTRFCHQKAMDEMFRSGLEMEERERFTFRLKSDIPLDVHFICIDGSYDLSARRHWVYDTQIESEPMRRFWQGVKEEGWPDVRAFAGKRYPTSSGLMPSHDKDEEFSESSFAILGRQYMILSLRMGFHFTTVEAFCSEHAAKNYIRMQFKLGGASPDRRIRRIRLLENILSPLGFEHHSQGDFLDSRLSYRDRKTIGDRLYRLGRLTLLTKQLDMALNNDRITEWYIKDIKKKLELEEKESE
jgi:pyruvate,water dikinase